MMLPLGLYSFRMSWGPASAAERNRSGNHFARCVRDYFTVFIEQSSTAEEDHGLWLKVEKASDGSLSYDFLSRF